VGRNLSTFYADKSDGSEILGRLIKGKAVVNRETKLVRKGGGIRHVQINANVMWEDGRFIHARYFILDMTDLKRAREQLERLAHYDPLTGLPNRAQFLNILGRAWTRNAASPALLYMDLDDFKTVNDRQGHAAGDALLTGVGQTFQDCLRPGDVAGRIGGDEFAILLMNVSNRAEAAAVAERILAGLPVALDRRAAASLGIAMSSGRYASPDTMLNAADEAMYKVKRGNKAGFAFAYLPNQEQTFKVSM
jgi:diguanylate cyclase (GGDEF)-like protein